MGYLIHLRKVSHHRFSWSVKNDEGLYIAIGLFLSVLVSTLSIALPAVKSTVTNKIFKKKQYNSTLIVKERDSTMT